MKLLLKITFLLLLASTFTTCTDRNYFYCTNANTTKIPQHAMDFFFFKTGSWWVYEEESSGELDTIWAISIPIEVDAARRAKRDCLCGYGRCVQHAEVAFYSSNKIGQFLYGYSIWSDFDEEGISNVGEGDGVYNNPSGYRITYNGSEYVKKSPTYGTYEDLPSITVKGKTYTDILHHYYTQQSNIPDWQHEAWYARNIYLVKFRLWNGTTWNLVKSHTIK